MKEAFKKIRRALFPSIKDILEDYVKDNNMIIHDIECFKRELNRL